jgi:hypothetical protein
MPDLLEMMEKKRQQFAQAAKLNEILSRDDSDFLTYRKIDGSLGAAMRWSRCPKWVWSGWKVVLALFVETKWQERRWRR